MDMKVAQKKLGLKERYRLLTRDLGWTPSYQSNDALYPYVHYEGIKIHDWDKWEDPFRLTMDSYWKYQAEKERKFYAIVDAHVQNNGHLNLTDGRYLTAIKMFLQAISPGEYAAHRGFARVGREFPGVGTQVACQMQSIDEIRHAQTQIHAISNYNKYYNGFAPGHDTLGQHVVHHRGDQTQDADAAPEPLVDPALHDRQIRRILLKHELDAFEAQRHVTCLVGLCREAEGHGRHVAVEGRA